MATAFSIRINIVFACEHRQDRLCNIVSQSHLTLKGVTLALPRMELTAPKPRVTAYTAFKRNHTIRKISSPYEKPLQYKNTWIVLFLFTATNTTLKEMAAG